MKFPPADLRVYPTFNGFLCCVLRYLYSTQTNYQYAHTHLFIRPSMFMSVCICRCASYFSSCPPPQQYLLPRVSARAQHQTLVCGIKYMQTRTCTFAYIHMNERHTRMHIYIYTHEWANGCIRSSTDGLVPSIATPRIQHDIPPIPGANQRVD